MQDEDLFYHGIGHSIENAGQADIIFLGWSRLLFAMDWRVFDDFERVHDAKMFNMGFAGVASGEFPLRVIRKWRLHPKLWVINTDRDINNDFRAGFFHRTLNDGLANSVTRTVGYGWLWAYKNVIGRNMRWRGKMALDAMPMYSFRSARMGNWYLDNWPNYNLDTNAPITRMTEMRQAGDGTLQQVDRAGPCPTLPEEVEEAKSYIGTLGGTVVLIQAPSTFACAQRVHELAAAVGVPAFTVPSNEFTSVDGGGHLDGKSARKYSELFFNWLRGLPEFQRLFGNAG